MTTYDLDLDHANLKWFYGVISFTTAAHLMDDTPFTWSPWTDSNADTRLNSEASHHREANPHRRARDAPNAETSAAD